MKGPKYIMKDPHKLKFQNHAMKMHLKALEGIKNKKSRLLDCSTPDTYYMRPNHSPSKYQTDEIIRKNQSLLDRLIYIILPKKPKNLKSLSKDPSPLTNNFPKSINLTQRKHFEKKIYMENRNMAHRLASISPCVNRKNIDKDFTHHMKYKAIVCKYKGLDFVNKTSVQKKKIASLSEIPSQRHMIYLSPSGNIKSPNSDDELNTIKHEWKVVAISDLPSSKYLMAVPMAISTG
ncbi:hypothetical protein SteCoe_5968 [Stentor coeruleus]|uniref:Uncharacterized protein n=1 Tax=Stentor coeruleus TaxID=5963 RepID=A0A1R2CR81_9CILI|nr:hypothetical protein SteCoe_5968 [Stentor coeruleus]